jgi:hypothetical protein
MPRSSPHLVVDVKLLPEPCLWCWEIRDTHSGTVESSWDRDWTAYESRQQALTAGLERAARRSLAPSPGRRPAAPPAPPRAIVPA